MTSQTTATFNSDLLQANGVSTDGFSAFYCDPAAAILTDCRKLQYWPAASWANGFRFEKDNKAMAYVYDASAGATTVAVKWMDEE